MEAAEPAMRWASGAFVRWAEVQHYLELAALVGGLEAQEVGSHRLRIGATAMYPVVDDPEKVRRFGRWNSDAFHISLKESHEPMRPIARGTAAGRTELIRPVTAMKRGLAEAAGMGIDQGEAARALTWQKDKAGQRDRTK